MCGVSVTRDERDSFEVPFELSLGQEVGYGCESEWFGHGGKRSRAAIASAGLVCIGRTSRRNPYSEKGEWRSASEVDQILGIANVEGPVLYILDISSHPQAESATRTAKRTCARLSYPVLMHELLFQFDLLLLCQGQPYRTSTVLYCILKSLSILKLFVRSEAIV